MALVRINKNDFIPGFIGTGKPEQAINYEYIPAYIKGNNLFLYITDGYEDEINVNYTKLPDQFGGLPNDAEQLIGEGFRIKYGLEKRKQVGKNSMDDNE